MSSFLKSGNQMPLQPIWQPGGRNILAHVPSTNITAIAVGSEVLTALPNAAPSLVSSMKFIHSALVASNIDPKIKVSTPYASSIILDSFPPSQAFFNRTWDPVMVPMLKFLQSTVVTKSGWPSKGDSMEPDASIENANTYNSNLIRPGSISEKNLGLSDFSGAPIYILHLIGSGTIFANDTTNQTYCVSTEGADPKMLQAALDWACGPGKVDCSALLQREPCYEPDNVVSHANYAFDTTIKWPWHRVPVTSMEWLLSPRLTQVLLQYNPSVIPIYGGVS